MTIFIIVVVFLRITNIYDINAHIYAVELNVWQGYLACWILYAIDVFIFLKIPTNKSTKLLLVISIIWCVIGNLIWNSMIVKILEFIFLLVTPFILTRKWKVLLYIIILLATYSVVQLLFVYGLLGSLTEYNKYDALMIICLMLYYQVYVIVSYLNIKMLRRRKL